MTHCLLCDKEVFRQTSWFHVVTSSVVPSLCGECHEQFQRIEGETCVRCHRPLSEEVNHSAGCCYDCFRWEEDESWRGVLSSNQSIYVYDSYMKEVVGKFKFRGDIVLGDVFKKEMQTSFLSHFTDVDVVVPIPLSDERLYERGFNQAYVLEACVSERVLEPLVRLHTEKQSKKSREERIHLADIFQCVTSEEIRGKHVLLVDDVYTTGATLRYGAKVLLENGARKVSSLTLAR